MKIGLEGICLVVPQGYMANGSQRVMLPHDSDWPTALEAIYRGISCETVAWKPPLSFKLDKWATKIFSLSNAQDLMVLREEVQDKEKKQKQGATVIKVDVIVPDEVCLFSPFIIDKLLILLQYIFSLRKKLLGKTYVAPGKGKAKALLIDLDSTMDQPASEIGSADQVSTVDDLGLTACEKSAYELLVNHLQHCVGCPHSTGSYCLKTTNNSHVRFTSHWVKGWAKALVRFYASRAQALLIVSFLGKKSHRGVCHHAPTYTGIQLLLHCSPIFCNPSS